MSVKDTVRALLDRLPDDCTFEDVLYHLYVIQVERGDRGEMAAFLAERGIQTGIHYPRTIPATPAFGERTGQWPAAEAAARRILSLPMHPHLTEEQVERVARGIREHMESVLSDSARDLASSAV